MRNFAFMALGGLLAAEVAAKESVGAFFQSKTVIIPKDSHMKDGGQDAAESDDTCLVVADGVGGYEKLGIDPRDFARELTKSALKKHETDPNMESKDLLDHGCTEA